MENKKLCSLQKSLQLHKVCAGTVTVHVFMCGLSDAYSEKNTK